MANIIPVHEDKVAGPDTALTMNALATNVFGMSGERRTPDQQEQRQRSRRLSENRHYGFECNLAKERESSLSDKNIFTFWK